MQIQFHHRTYAPQNVFKPLRKFFPCYQCNKFQLTGWNSRNEWLQRLLEFSLRLSCCFICASHIIILFKSMTSRSSPERVINLGAVSASLSVIPPSAPFWLWLWLMSLLLFRPSPGKSVRSTASCRRTLASEPTDCEAKFIITTGRWEAKSRDSQC